MDRKLWIPIIGIIYAIKDINQPVKRYWYNYQIMCLVLLLIFGINLIIEIYGVNK